MSRANHTFPKFLASVACVSTLLVWSSASAGTIQGVVEYVQIGHGYTPDNVYALVKFDTSASGQPACATDSLDRFAINPATEAGQALLAVLVAAHATQSTVHVFGTGTCDVMGSAHESISYLRVF